jgi:hypothetical protein
VKTGVIPVHQGYQVLFPIQGGFIDIGGEVLGNGFVGNFGLAVGPGMPGSGEDIFNSEVAKELFSHLAQKSLPWSVMRLTGVPKMHTQFSKMAVATLAASLLGRTTSYTYFVKAFVMHKRYFFPDRDILSGPNKLVNNFWLGSVGCGR